MCVYFLEGQAVRGLEKKYEIFIKLIDEGWSYTLAKTKAKIHGYQLEQMKKLYPRVLEVRDKSVLNNIKKTTVYIKD